jgi:hypothetical protein
MMADALGTDDPILVMPATRNTNIKSARIRHCNAVTLMLSIALDKKMNMGIDK